MPWCCLTRSYIVGYGKEGDLFVVFGYSGLGLCNVICVMYIGFSCTQYISVTLSWHLVMETCVNQCC